jgi:hypothetical protein
MTKYIIEGGINFYDELYKSLDESTNDDEHCLITNTPLEKDCVKLVCKHSFNYEPLFKELCKQKKNINDENYMVNKSHIKCPYCRSIQSELLPVKEGFALIYGVNSLNKNLLYNNNNAIPPGYIQGTCDYVVDDINGGIVVCSEKYLYVTKMTNGKCYCVHHKYYGIKIYWESVKAAAKKEKEAKMLKLKEAKEKTNQEKEKTNQEKEKTKQEKEKTKQLLKESKDILKQEKEKTKALVKIKNELIKQQKESLLENTIISATMCQQLLKTGIKKGQPCGCKVYQNNSFCLRHFNLNVSK